MHLRAFPGHDMDTVPAPPLEETPVPEEHLLGQFIPLHYHYNMLQDQDRVGAFREAIRLAVKPGMHVVELGGGTGILSSFAARQGARVSCVERNPQLVRTARRLLRQNGLEDRVEVIEQDAFAYLPSEPVDVVICEMLHVAMVREKQLPVIESFKRRYLRAFGETKPLPRFLPEASILMVQPVEHSFDFAGYWAPVPVFQPPRLHIAETRELSPLKCYADVAYEQPFPTHFDCAPRFSIEQSGSVTAVRFVTQNVVAVDVDQQRAVTWPNQCLVLPLESPQQVETGQELQIRFCYSAGDSIEDLAGPLAVGDSSAGEQSAIRRHVA